MPSLRLVHGERLLLNEVRTKIVETLQYRSCAHDLAIAGLVPLSAVDWPGHLVATVFAQGCPWQCVYCHNHAIIDPTTPGVVAWHTVVELLSRRRGLLDGLVFSGGEPLRQSAVLDAAREVKEMGYSVGVHTGGVYPRMLRELCEAGLVDWVGLDIKAQTEEQYRSVIGRTGGAAKAWESLDILLEFPQVDYETRLTAFPGMDCNPVALASLLKSKGVRNFHLQRVRSQGAPEGFLQTQVVTETRGWDQSADWDQQVTAWREEIEAMGFDCFSVRG